MVRIGIIGAGNIALRHLEACRIMDDVSVAVFASTAMGSVCLPLKTTNSWKRRQIFRTDLITSPRRFVISWTAAREKRCVLPLPTMAQKLCGS